MQKSDLEANGQLNATIGPGNGQTSAKVRLRRRRGRSCPRLRCTQRALLLYFFTMGCFSTNLAREVVLIQIPPGMSWQIQSLVEELCLHCYPSHEQGGDDA